MILHIVHAFWKGYLQVVDLRRLEKGCQHHDSWDNDESKHDREIIDTNFHTFHIAGCCLSKVDLSPSKHRDLKMYRLMNSDHHSIVSLSADPELLLEWCNTMYSIYYIHMTGSEPFRHSIRGCAWKTCEVCLRIQRLFGSSSPIYQITPDHWACLDEESRAWASTIG